MLGSFREAFEAAVLQNEAPKFKIVI